MCTLIEPEHRIVLTISFSTWLDVKVLHITSHRVFETHPGKRYRLPLCKKTLHGDSAANLEETVTSSRFGSVILQPLQFAGISPIKDWFLSIATNGQKLLCKALIVWGILVVRCSFEWEHQLLRKYLCGN